MEIYTNSKTAERTVFLEFPLTATSIDAFIYRAGVLVHTITQVTPVVVSQQTEGYSAVIPFNLVSYDQDLELRWELTYTEGGVEYTAKRTSHVRVVTPILSKTEIRAIDNIVFATDAECARIEKAVRLIIQAYTGQQFSAWVGTESIRGGGGTALFLPRKLINLDTVNGSNYVSGYSIDPEGYVLRKSGYGGTEDVFDVPPVKADFYGLHMHVGGMIHDPNGVRYQQWIAKRTYNITGRWGWEEVPAAVKEAAKLLVNDYACADAQYRDRYLQSMTAADWRIQFNSGAFVRTGNVRADQLLSDYVVTRGWGVI